MNSDAFDSDADVATLSREVRNLAPLVRPTLPNPAPLGLFVFGLTTALFMSKNVLSDDADKIGTTNLLWGFAMFFGGLLQIIVGLVEVRRNNVFGFTAFSSFGGFWLSVGTSNIVAILAGAENVKFSSTAAIAVNVMMGFYSLVLWVCTFRMNLVIWLLFLFIALTFFTLAAGVQNPSVDYAAGWIGIITASISYLYGTAELLNEVMGNGKQIIPLGNVNSIWAFFSGHKDAVESQESVPDLRGSFFAPPRQPAPQGTRVTSTTAEP